MTTGAHILAMSIASIAAGTVLLVLKTNEAMATLLVTSGVGGFWREIHVAKKAAQEAKAETKEAKAETQQIAQELFERTGTTITKKPSV